MSLLSSETFAFLDELSCPRDKSWFEANRARYEAHLLGPMRALVSAIGPGLQAQIPDLECRPQVNKSLTRINRDMRFARGQSPYKDHMLALFYRQGRKKEDPQLFVGVQPMGVWAGLYLSPALLAAGSPMGNAVSACPDAVVALGKGLGLGGDLSLSSCSCYGAVEKSMNGEEAGHYLTGSHLCAMRTFTVGEVVADPDGFVETADEILGRLIPLWKAYLHGL
ncbi:MAG: DUF2461 family protein [Methylococcaceae bacterium]|nr:DUF2461 family protein [Methylococcaceae bacterium]